jgi:hypothetical protein
MVVGNFQASAASYKRILSQEIGGVQVFWRHLRNVMAATDPREVFLTNAHPAFPDIDSDTERFLSTPEFKSLRRVLAGDDPAARAKSGGLHGSVGAHHAGQDQPTGTYSLESMEQFRVAGRH